MANNENRDGMELPKRKPQRLQEYDYSQNGAYFVTICTQNKRCTLGHICRDTPGGCPPVVHTQLGKIANDQIQWIEDKYHIQFEKYVIMPNHIHAIVLLEYEYESGHPQGASLQQIIGAYKSRVSSEYLKYCKENNVAMGTVWQRSFHDHIIRNQKSYLEIWQYIDTNPLKWELDCFYEST